jgi:hypothetical protein
MPAVDRPITMIAPDPVSRKPERDGPTSRDEHFWEPTEHFWLFSPPRRNVSVIHSRVFGGNAGTATVWRLKITANALAVPSLFSAVLAG